MTAPVASSPSTALTLRNIATDQTVATTVSGAEGEYAFRNLAPGKYEVTAVKDGFQQVSLNDVVVPLGTQVRVDVTLPVGGLQDRVEVTSGTSVLNTTATQEHGITPETLQQLPLLMNSGPRAAAGFAILMPGVSTGGGSNAFDARINGGLQSGDEATVDGVSMQQGFMSQGGMVSIFQDFPMSPDMVSEVKVLTSNYAPGVRLVDVRPDHGRDPLRRQRVPRRRLHLPPRRLAQGDAVGRRQQAGVQPQQLRRQHRRPGASCPACGTTRSRASSSSTTRATARPAARTRRRCRFRRSGNATATSPTGATAAAT